uniref:CCT domain-containing protein n=1 Tax=Tanacetum cinerariifolium TaxID=118510 RepID=A0A6L2M5M8_TANCI|nr:CCT domain-containing protein [Tanacetum cinerariifolium]
MVDPDDGSLRNMESNILTGSAEGNAANYGSRSGSNNKSNGENGSSWQKGSSFVQVIEIGKLESDNGVAKNDNGIPKKGNGVVIICNDRDGSGSGSGQQSGVDQERLSQRAATLNKFR